MPSRHLSAIPSQRPRSDSLPEIAAMEGHRYDGSARQRLATLVRPTRCSISQNASRQRRGDLPSGGVAEWSKALVLKTSEGNASQGSNPCPSANNILFSICYVVRTTIRTTRTTRVRGSVSLDDLIPPGPTRSTSFPRPRRPSRAASSSTTIRLRQLPRVPTNGSRARLLARQASRRPRSRTVNTAIACDPRNWFLA